jgi:hypothetical protein
VLLERLFKRQLLAGRGRELEFRCFVPNLQHLKDSRVRSIPARTSPTARRR